MATIAFGVGGLAGLVAAAGYAAFAGAIGLGVAGLATSLGIHKYGKKYGHYGHGHSGYGYRGYRGKRSAEDESTAIQNLLEVIRSEDVTGCGLKLVCELAGVDEEELYEEELAILNLIGPVINPGEGLLPPGGAGDYMAAKSFGTQHGNCAQAFSMCPLNGTELMEAISHFLP